MKSTTSRSLAVSAIDATCSTADGPEAEKGSDAGRRLWICLGEDGAFGRLHDSARGVDNGAVIGAREGMLGRLGTVEILSWTFDGVGECREDSTLSTAASSIALTSCS